MSRPATFLSSTGFTSLDGNFSPEHFGPPLHFYFSASSICPSINHARSSLAPTEPGLAWFSPDDMTSNGCEDDCDCDYEDDDDDDRPGTTAAYHETLIDQHRQLASAARLSAPPSSSRNFLCWIHLPRPRDNSSLGRADGHAPDLKKPTQQDIEEFEALPNAIRRKFFSSTERLRFARLHSFPRLCENNSTDRGDLPHPVDVSSYRYHQFLREVCRPPNLGSEKSLPSEGVTAETGDGSEDHLYLLANLTPKVLGRYLTREEQSLLAKTLRESVILDAAGEVLRRLDRRTSKQLNIGADSEPPSFSSTSLDMEPVTSERVATPDGGQDPFYDSFRWLDNDDNLDLRLGLQDYQENTTETPLHVKDTRMSFRRHLSLTKIPFNRGPLVPSSPTSVGDCAAGTTETPDSHPTTNTLPRPANGRRKSRRISLIAPKHTAQPSITSIDPDAAHYQDPETRLKLRVFLASPQRFDEAIEYGFPSRDVQTPDSEKAQTDQQHVMTHTRQNPSRDSERLKTFLSDDRSSTYSEDISTAESESPKTPYTPDRPGASEQIPAATCAPVGTSFDHLAQTPAATREMTLRMTLTRPDLRACEDQIYGWQRDSSRQSGRASQASNVRHDSPPPSAQMKYASKESIDRVFADIDQELSESQDAGVMKRMWKRVRRI